MIPLILKYTPKGVINLTKPKLKIIREKSFTQREVSEKLEIPLKTYQNYEQGVRVPKIDTLKRLATIFNCKVDDLI